MSCINSNILAGASGSAGGDPVYVDDVFSTTLYKGNSSNQATLQSQQIINGIDLSGEGGLVWTKSRSTGAYWSLWDTERTLTGSNNWIRCDSTNIATTTGQVTGFNNNGYTLGEDNTHQVINYLNTDYASWTFRKQKGFFDVVTYTGTGYGRTVPHNLSSTPGMIFCKCTSHSSDWMVWHRSFTSNGYCVLNNTNAFNSSNYFITGTSSTTFTFGGDNTVNQSGRSYVAYVFAHDDAQFGTDGDESIIKCGGYTGNGSAAGQEINLGFEPQFVFISGIEFTYNGTRYGGGWYLLDSTRGIFTGENDPSVQTQETNAEAASSNMKMELTPTGFKIVGNGTHENYSGGKYMYMAIRRPNKPPELATEVFAVTSGNNNNNPTFTSGFPVDLAFWKIYVSGSTDDFKLSTRLLGSTFQVTNANGTEQGYSPIKWDRMDGWVAVSNGTSYISYMFKRTPGFIDAVPYIGTGSSAIVSHNLTSAPEFLIVKKRNGVAIWRCYHKDLASANDVIHLNESAAAETNSAIWNGTAPTSTHFSVGSNHNVSGNGDQFIAYLFATLPGISKVGSYTGNGGSSAFDVDCGFTNGARFVLIKDRDSSNDWYVWDTVRGMTSSAAPYVRLNSSGQQSTSDWVETQTSGFKVNTGSPANIRINISGNTYLFLAIA